MRCPFKLVSLPRRHQGVGVGIASDGVSGCTARAPDLQNVPVYLTVRDVVEAARVFEARTKILLS